MTDMVKNELIKTKIPWTPYAPIGWDIKRAKFIFKSKKEINSQMQCNDRLALTLKGVIDRFEGDNIGLNPNDLRTYQIFQPNELVFKLLDLDNKKTSRVGFVHKKGIMSSAYIRVLENPNMNMRYFYYQYFDLYQRFIFNDIGQGVRATMSSSDLLNIPILIPPLETQNAIVNYLDRKTQQIQEFITKKERLIELLEEQLKRKINDALTKGIYENVEFKSIDLTEIEQIPKHWKFKKFKWITSIISCGIASTPEYVDEDKGVAFLSAQNCRPFRMDLEKYNFISPKLHKQLTQNKKPEKGDVLVTRVGAGIGDACIIDIDLEFSIYVSLTHIRPTKEILNEYVVYFFQTYYCDRLNFNSTVEAGGQGNLNVKNVEKYRIPLPPINEQKEICSFLNNSREQVSYAIAKAQSEIEKAKEYQESLITQVVSGQLKVPEKTYSNVHYREFDMVAEQGSSYHT